MAWKLCDKICEKCRYCISLEDENLWRKMSGVRRLLDEGWLCTKRSSTVATNPTDDPPDDCPYLLEHKMTTQKVDRY